MIQVLVQIMGPVEAAPGSYDWITIGRINEPESIDSGYLREIAMKGFGPDGDTFHSPFDVLRFVVVKDGITEMKIMLTDCFKERSRKADAY